MYDNEEDRKWDALYKLEWSLHRLGFVDLDGGGWNLQDMNVYCRKYGSFKEK